MTTAPTPEVAAYHAAREATETTLRRLRRRFLAVLAAVAIFVVVMTSVTFNKIDHKFSDTQVSVDNAVSVIQKVRTTQVHNTKISDQRAQCQTKAINAGLTDALLAVEGKLTVANAQPIVKC